MILVDTSVLIDFLKGRHNEAINKFEYVSTMNIPWGINVFVYQELLQGVSSEKDYALLKEYLNTQIFYSLKKDKESFADAAEIYLKCRKKGYTIKSTIDCLIAQTAIENDLFLLHNDIDFTYISKVVKNFKVY